MTVWRAVAAWRIMVATSPDGASAAAACKRIFGTRGGHAMNQTELTNKIDAYLEKNWDAMVDDIATLDT